MKNNPFSDIAKKSQKANKTDFIESAKVDGTSKQETKVDGTSKQETKLDKNERRGSSYIDKETKKRIPLSGKIVQVPVNGYELKILEAGAQKAGLPLGSYLRTLGLEAANNA
jgi:hypothetical protein